MNEKEEEENLNDELSQLDFRLTQLEQEIILLEIEKQSLLKRKKACTSQLNDLKPTSSGGNKTDASSDWNRTDFKWSQTVDTCLKNTFKLNSFRPLQLETINVTMSKQDCLVVMPTGGGKSLCFQLPAVIDEGVTLVVSPLVSLMEDQLWILKSLNINAAKLNSAATKEEQKYVHTQMLDSKSDLKILYVTPEKLAKSKQFMNKLEKMYELKRFHRLVIDEVHCCSTYGHDFRPDYKFLGVMKRLFPNVSILGLTATATSNVIDDIKKILDLKNFVLFKASFNRPNLFYEVRDKPGNHDECMNSIAELIKQKFHNQSGIVYCFSQRESEQVANDLRQRSIQAEFYHAQLDAEQRTKVHDKWLKNKTHVIVATIAFGMGIDKPNCRFVIHHSLSKSLENFYQESGRAGRDGATAYSILYFRFADIFRQSSMVFTEQTGLTNLYSIVNYCIDLKRCKRILIAEHFNDFRWSKVGECHKMCCICERLVATTSVNCIREARIVLNILDKHSVKEKQNRLTANKLVELVSSEITKSRNPDDEYKLTQIDIEHLILKMLMRQHLQEDFHFTPYNTICYLVKANKSLPQDVFEMDFNLQKSNDKSEIKKVKKVVKKMAKAHIEEDLVVLDSDGDDDLPKKKLKK